MDKNLPADVCAEVNERLDILLGFYPDEFVRMIDVKAFRLDEEPMKPNDLNSVLFSGPADRFPLFMRDFCHRIAKRVRGVLDSVITQLSRIAKNPVHRPSPEEFIAYRDFHLTTPPLILYYP